MPPAVKQLVTMPDAEDDDGAMLQDAAAAAEALGADRNDPLGTPHVEILPNGRGAESRV